MTEQTQMPKRQQGKNAAWVVVLVGFLTVWEGFAPVGHHDSIDPPGVNTVCFGHIENVKIGERHTKVECQEMLADDIPRYTAMVNKCIQVQMPDYRRAAITSFTYNVGGGALCKSSVARKLNAGDVQGGCEALMLYVKSNGQFRQGLQNRRAAERKLCLNDANAPDPAPVAQKDQINVDAGLGKAPVDKKIVVAAPKPAPAPAPVEQHGALYRFWHKYILGW